jgi:hypothetical protein
VEAHRVVRRRCSYIFYTIGSQMARRLSALSADRLLSPGTYLAFISVTGCVDPGATVRPEGLVNGRICLNLLQHYSSNMCVIGDETLPNRPPPPKNSRDCLSSVRLRRIMSLMSLDTARRSLNHISGSLHELITDQQCSNLLPRRPLETQLVWRAAKRG